MCIRDRNSGELTASSLGSGVVLTEDGYIITNNHVIEGGEAYEVTVEGVTYEADLVGACLLYTSVLYCQRFITVE